MNKIIKRKLIGSAMCLVLGIVGLIFLAVSPVKISEEVLSYLNGFGVGLIIIGIITLIRYTRIMKNEKMSKQLENANNDERLKVISNESMAIAFRISVITQVVISMVCAIYNKMEIAGYIEIVVTFQTMVYLVTYFIISKKN